MSRLKIEHRVDLYSSRCIYDPSFIALAEIVFENMTLMQKVYAIAAGKAIPLAAASQVRQKLLEGLHRQDLLSKNCQRAITLVKISRA